MTLLLALLFAASPPGAGPAERFERANARFRAGDFAGAAAEYEALRGEGLGSPSLHLNLGNARMRLGQRGAAIASWERALRLDPSDVDARENLRGARADDPDRAIAGEPPLLGRLVERTAAGTAVALFLVPWWILWGALALRGRAAGRGRNALGVLALLSSLGVAAGGALLSAAAHERGVPRAILVAPSAPLRSGPSWALKADLVLHEGTRVRVLGSEAGLVRVRLDGGLEGWLEPRDLVPL